MRTLHEAYMAACGRKIAYEDRSAAEATAQELMRRSPYGEVLVVYRCPFAPLGEGGHYHVGHLRGTKPKPKLLRGRRWAPPRITFQAEAAEHPPRHERPRGRRPAARAERRPTEGGRGPAPAAEPPGQ